jgi:leader peptidase (prepilin peptidase)/N-methyltransferase
MLIKFGPTLTGSIYYIFIACLLVITFIDIDQQIIPDAITLPGILIFLGASFFIPESSFKDSATGIIAGGGILYTIAFFYNFITKTQGMGGGDIKLLAMIGAILGWKGVIFTIFTSSLLGTFSGIIIMLVQKKNMKLAIPFGPFLSMGAITYLFWGSSLIKWYLNLAQ